ncbi:MAG: hypothetical protein ACRDH9_00060 [Actinomycetota bacterium]
MADIRKLLALSLTAMLLVFAGATGALAGHKPGHQEPPSCDPHPTKPGFQNKHCDDPATTPPTTPPPTNPPPGNPPPGNPPPTTPPPVTGTGGNQPPTTVGGAGGGGGNGGGGGGGGGPVADAPTAVTTDELPFTGLDLPEALLAAGLLLTLGGASLALGKRRARVS